MGKLHQHLAVENDVKSGEEKIRSECMATFTKKQHHFDGLISTYKPDKEEEQNQVLDDKHIVETVQSKLDYTQGAIIRLLDFNLQKEVTNTKAKSDLVIEDNDGKEVTIAQGIPATMLLNLEKRMLKVRDLYNAIPTCDPAKVWEKDDNEGIYRAQTPETKIKTKKTPTSYVKAEATEKHPAQIEFWFEDVRVGIVETVHKTGRLTPAEKSNLLDRIDILIRGIKKSRQKANDFDIENVKIGKKLFNYIHG